MESKIYHIDSDSLSRHEQFKSFAQQAGELFDVKKAAEILKLLPADATKVLSRWQKLGFIFRIKQGLYTLIPIDSPTAQFTPEDFWIAIPTLFDPGYIGGFSALEHWDLTEQIFNSICVFTTKHVKNKTPNIAGQSFLINHIQSHQLFGLTPIWRKQTKVMMSDMHRTIIDIFDRPENGGGIQHAIDCLKEYLRKPEANPEKLAEYAIQMNKGAVFKRLGYFLSLFIGQQHPLVNNFKEHLTQGYAYLDPKQKTEVKLSRRWQLWIPKTLDIGAEA